MQDMSISIARTNKLYCSGCRRKIKKGQDVVFFLNVDEITGKRTMDYCYCTNCKDGQEEFNEYIFQLAEEDAFGIGQS